MPILSGIHPVAEALRAHHPLERVLIAQGAGGTRLQEIIDLARRAAVPLRFEPRSALDRLAGTSAHQGVVALGAAKKYAGMETAGASRLVVVLDGVEDPHNLGAVIRTALAAGAHGVVIPERRAAGLTDTVARASAGALGITMIVAIASAKWADVDSLETLLGFDEFEYLALFLWIAIAGAGPLAVDHWLQKRFSPPGARPGA